MNLWHKLELLPPVAVRLLAKNPDGSAMTHDRIVARTAGGLSLADVKWLSYLPSWDDVPVCKVKLFLDACDCDLTNPSKVRTLNRYLRRDPKFTHLRRSEMFPEFRQMLGVYFAALK